MLTERWTRARSASGRDIEADHLPPGVHAGICAAGAGQLDRVAQDPLKRVPESGGDGGDLPLQGKAVERRPQIGDDQAQTAVSDVPARRPARPPTELLTGAGDLQGMARTPPPCPSLPGLDELDTGHGGVVAVPRPELEDAGIAT